MHLPTYADNGAVSCTTTFFEAAKGMTDFNPLESRDQLFRASNFLCSILAEKREIADLLHLPVDELVLQATGVALSYVRGTALQPADPLISVASRRNNPVIKREFDSTSTRALVYSNQSKIIEAAHRTTEGGERKLLFLPLANGAIPTALMHYDTVDAALSGGSTMYPVRFSVHKVSHQAPLLEDDECKFIMREAEAGAQVVVFDEDTWTGETMRRTIRYCRRELGVPNDQINGLTVLRGGDRRRDSHAICRMGTEGLEYEIL